MNKRYSILGTTAKTIKYIVLSIYAAICLFPMLWIILNSLKNNEEIYSNPIGLPKIFKFYNYLKAWESANISQYFINSMIISLGTVFLVIIITSMIAFVLTRIKKSRKLKTYFLFGLMIPAHAMLIPLFIILRTVNLTNTPLGLTLIYTSVEISFSLYILCGFMSGIPKELDEAAAIDGAGMARIFFSIIMPLAKPGIATIATFAFLDAWNDYLFAQVMMITPTIKTLTQGIANLQGQYSTDYGLLCSGLAIAIIPVVIIYILFQEQVVQGMTAGSVKG